ncbi:MAG: response regulator [Candidatus Omnitrophota bacterium]|jgi:DNA-binding response OmpR family regulator
MAYKLLLVDDDKDIIEVLKPRLQREGYDVITAFDGEECLVMVKEHNPDIILLDLLMPKINGFEVLKEIRANYNDHWRPIIIISANSDLASIKKSYDLEADHYLAKPCTIDTVLRGIKTMISLLPARIK